MNSITDFHPWFHKTPEGQAFAKTLDWAASHLKGVTFDRLMDIMCMNARSMDRTRAFWIERLFIALDTGYFTRSNDGVLWVRSHKPFGTIQ